MKIPPPPQFAFNLTPIQLKEINLWMYKIWERLVEAGVINSSPQSESTLLKIADRRHELLQEILGVNLNSNNLNLDKHVSDALAKGWEQHRQATTNVHGVWGALASKTDVENLSDRIAMLQNNVTSLIATDSVLYLADQDLRDTDAQIQADLAALQTDVNNHTAAQSGVHGVSGNVVGTTDTQELTNKTIDGTNNTITNLALSVLATEPTDANKVIRRNDSGAVISGNSVPNSSPIVTIDSTQTVSNKVLDSSNKFGGDTDYSMFESDGTLRFVGAATVFRDELGDVSRLRVSGVGISFDTAEHTLDFANNADLNDYVIANYQLNHDWKQGSIIKPHVHFWQTNNAIPNLLIRYRWQRNGQAKTTAWTNLPLTSLAFSYSANINQIAYNANGITPPNDYNISDILQIRLFRDNANASGAFPGADTYTGDVEVTAIDVHVECDTIGSQTEYMK